MKKFTIRVNGQSYDVEVSEEKNSTGNQQTQTQRANSAASATDVSPKAETPQPSAATAQPVAAPPEGGTIVSAPMPGKVLSVKAKVGQSVNKGDLLLTLEAMKMENEIAAPIGGKVADIRVSANQTVKAGEIMVVIS